MSRKKGKKFAEKHESNAQLAGFYFDFELFTN